MAGKSYCIPRTENYDLDKLPVKPQNATISPSDVAKSQLFPVFATFWLPFVANIAIEFDGGFFNNDSFHHQPASSSVLLQAVRPVTAGLDAMPFRPR